MADSLQITAKWHEDMWVATSEDIRVSLPRLPRWKNFRKISRLSSPNCSRRILISSSEKILRSS